MTAQTATGTITPLDQISVETIKATVRSIPDFPKPGILFRDMMPILKDPVLLNHVIDYFYHQLKDKNIQYVVGIESRGFILGTPLACKLGAGFVPIRKIGKLPGLVEKHEYDLEYGSDTVEIQADALETGANVALIDDLLATGGTCAASAALLGKLNVNIEAILFLIELDALNGRSKLPQDVDVHTMIHY